MPQSQTQAADDSPLIEENLNELSRQCPSLQSIDIAPKDFLYRQGDRCPYVFLIRRGIVKISCLTEQGDEWTVALLRQGDMIGRVYGDPADNAMTESAQSVGEVTVFRLLFADFKQLVLQRSELMWPIFEMQCLRRQQAERKLIDILAQPVESRIMAMLKELALLFGKRCIHGYSLEIRLTQQELADLVGASRPVVSTIMNELRGRGVLDYTRELICVKDDLFSSSAGNI